MAGLVAFLFIALAFIFDTDVAGAEVGVFLVILAAIVLPSIFEQVGGFVLFILLVIAASIPLLILGLICNYFEKKLKNPQRKRYIYKNYELHREIALIKEKMKNKS